MNDKETLEEAKICAVNKWVEGYNHLKLSDFEKNGVAVDFGNGWDEAIKWQAERMYSEEEVGELLYNVIGEYGKHYGIMIDGKMLNDLFEQFKKK